VSHFACHFVPDFVLQTSRHPASVDAAKEIFNVDVQKAGVVEVRLDRFNVLARTKMVIKGR